MDYSIYDLKRSFTLHEAALAWAETEHESENVQAAYNAMHGELLRDIKGGSLPHRITRDIRENWINRESATTDYTDWSKAEILRDDLYKWFEARELKPKFLCKEMRPKERKSGQKRQASKTKKKNELHALLEKVYLALLFKKKIPPNAAAIVRALKAPGADFDTKKIITEIKDYKISWKPTDGTSGKPMNKKAIQNYVTELHIKHKKHTVIKNIPA